MLSRKELAQFSADIARKDLNFRKDKFESEGDIGLTDADISEYHEPVFEKYDLPADAFIFPAQVTRTGPSTTVNNPLNATHGGHDATRENKNDS